MRKKLLMHLYERKMHDKSSEILDRLCGNAEVKQDEYETIVTYFNHQITTN